jgi:hypothetical protein
LPSNSGGACLTLQLRPEGSSQPIIAPSQVSFSRATEFIERLRSFFFFFLVSLISKPFQKYYRKAREGRSVQLDENLFVASVAAMRLLVSFTVEEAVAVLPVMDSAGVADSVKDIVKPSISKKGFLRRGFLNLSPAVKVSTSHSSLLESVVSLSTLDVKEDGVIGLPFPLSGCVTPIFERGSEFKVNGLFQSQK